MLPREEREMVDATVDLILKNCSMDRPASREEIAHQFGSACYACKFMPDNESAKRILAEVSWRISEYAREAGQLAAAIRKQSRWR
jgi:hypothetical protein